MPAGRQRTMGTQPRLGFFLASVQAGARRSLALIQRYLPGAGLLLCALLPGVAWCASVDDLILPPGFKATIFARSVDAGAS